MQQIDGQTDVAGLMRRFVRPAAALIGGVMMALFATYSPLVANQSPVSDQSPVAGQSPVADQSPVAEQSPPSTVPAATTPTAPPATVAPTTVAPSSSPSTTIAPVEPLAAFPTPDPVGSFDVATMAPGAIRVAGWALDPDVASAISIHAYVDGGFAASIDANVNRPDIGAAFAGFGNAHGFDVLVATGPGIHNVCIYGINVGAGRNVLIGCRSVTIGADPLGSFDVATMVPGATRVAGWTFDPSTANAIGLHLYVDGGFAGAIDANVSRQDIGSAFPGYGDSHGFDVAIAIAPGFHTVCAYGINQGPGSNSMIGCRWVMVNPDPIASFDLVSISSGGLRVAGWALDPDTANAIEVHVYVDGSFAGALSANANRSDIGAAFLGFGNTHGFDASFAIPGQHNVCAYGINQGPGSNVLIGCRSTS